jgi:hypothetical protein
MDSWLTFFGIWCAEGWVIDRRVCFTINNSRVKETLDRCFENLFIEMDNEHLVNYMSQFNVEFSKKFLPEWCFQLSKYQTRMLIDGMVLSNGGYLPNENYLFGTESTKLADQFMQLCLHAGWSSNKTVRSEYKYSCQMIVYKKENDPEVNNGELGEEEEFYNYSGSVHCVEVPGNVFMVRRNGKPVWTGNSRASGPYSQLVRQPSVGRARDGGLRMGRFCPCWHFKCQQVCSVAGNILKLRGNPV